MACGPYCACSRAVHCLGLLLGCIRLYCVCPICLQQLLEDAGVAYTGVTADYALNSCNRIALNKVSLPGPTKWHRNIQCTEAYGQWCHCLLQGACWPELRCADRPSLLAVFCAWLLQVICGDLQFCKCMQHQTAI
jgi:hypothetical protein